MIYLSDYNACQIHLSEMPFIIDRIESANNKIDDFENTEVLTITGVSLSLKSKTTYICLKILDFYVVYEKRVDLWGGKNFNNYNTKSKPTEEQKEFLKKFIESIYSIINNGKIKSKITKEIHFSDLLGQVINEVLIEKDAIIFNLDNSKKIRLTPHIDYDYIFTDKNYNGSYKCFISNKEYLIGKKIDAVEKGSIDMLGKNGSYSLDTYRLHTDGREIKIAIIDDIYGSLHLYMEWCNIEIWDIPADYKYFRPISIN